MITKQVYRTVRSQGVYNHTPTRSLTLPSQRWLIEGTAPGENTDQWVGKVADEVDHPANIWKFYSVYRLSGVPPDYTPVELTGANAKLIFCYNPTQVVIGAESLCGIWRVQGDPQNPGHNHYVYPLWMEPCINLPESQGDGDPQSQSVGTSPTQLDLAIVEDLGGRFVTNAGSLEVLIGQSQFFVEALVQFDTDFSGAGAADLLLSWSYSGTGVLTAMDISHHLEVPGAVNNVLTTLRVSGRVTGSVPGDLLTLNASQSVSGPTTTTVQILWSA